ncbi:MAG TPA: cobaltochelatase subunit CobN [Stellaceae bacterium]|jgi:cobaltochelatase CobN
MDKVDCKIVLILDPDAPQSAVERLRGLQADGYRVADIPADSDALMHALLAGDAEEIFPRGDYGVYFATLPRALQDKVTQRWGAPERDPAFRESRLDCGAFAIRAARFGNVIVAMQPSRVSEIDAPPHGYIAFYAWIADGIRAQAIVRLSKEGFPDSSLCAVPPLA